MSEIQNLNQSTGGNFIQKSRECQLNCEYIMFKTEKMKQNMTIIGISGTGENKRCVFERQSRIKSQTC